MNQPLLVRREVQIAAAPATVFAFLTDPEKILSWMGADATTEVHPGGLYLVKGIGNNASVARGAFREVVPVHRLTSASVGTETTRCRLDRVWSRSICSTGTVALCCA